ncbi:MAG: hypothetical protein HY656_07020 [Acidobacteria bacterium]|nr:hypothetical protein [Acidobacteriota bacterium]
MSTPLEGEPQGSLSLSPPLGTPAPGTEKKLHPGRLVLQRIGWRRPSADERRLWVVQGIVIVGAVLLIGALMFLALR